jgi:DNA-binding GntR family transcriptional regulator
MNVDLFRSKNERIYDLLKTKIIRGEMKPGDPIVIDTLAAQIGVSAIPIREALRHLEANGFVVIAPYVGARVTEIHAGSILEVFSALEALEIISSRAACETLTDEGIATLEKSVAAMRDMLDKPDEWSEANKQFHRAICRAAGMTVVEKMLSVALDHWDRLRCHYLEAVFAQRVEVRQAEHEQILDAFRRRDPEALEDVMRHHNQQAFIAYTSHLEKTGVLTKSESSA